MSPDTAPPATETQPYRRRFLLRLSWIGLSLFSATFLGALLRYIWPSVSGRKAMTIPVGFPNDYQPGQVVFLRGPKLFIVRDGKGFLAFSARCTHLGCLVVWNRDHRMFLCPCHGGKFDIEGRNVEGPPPRPLDLFALSLDGDGYLIVDQDLIIRRGNGPLPRFQPIEA